MKRAIGILLACTITEAISDVRPGAEWLLQGDRYENLTWLDQSQKKPTQQELDQSTVNCQAGEMNQKVQRAQAITDAKDTTKDLQTRFDAFIKAADLK